MDHTLFKKSNLEWYFRKREDLATQKQEWLLYKMMENGLILKINHRKSQKRIKNKEKEKSPNVTEKEQTSINKEIETTNENDMMLKEMPKNNNEVEFKQEPKVMIYSPFGHPIDEETQRKMQEYERTHDVFGNLRDRPLSPPKPRKITYLRKRTKPYDLDEEIEFERQVILNGYEEAIRDFGTEFRELFKDTKEKRLKALEERKESMNSSEWSEFWKEHSIDLPEGPIIFEETNFLDKDRAKYNCR